MPRRINLAIKPFHGKIYLKNGLFHSWDKNIFSNLDVFLIKKNIYLYTCDTHPEITPDRILFCDCPYPWEINYWILLLKNLSKSVLLCFESPIINPFSQMRLVQKLFSHVYSWEDSSRICVNKFYIPQTSFCMRTNPLAFEKKQFICLINSYKASYPLLQFLSPYKKNLYKERIKAIRFFENVLPNGFSLYGRGWPKKYFPSYFGQVKNKIACLKKYKYNLCFENNIAPGYISEKIFDCFKAGCVPIYYGASNIEKYIPSSAYIDFRDFSSYEQLLAFLLSITPNHYEKYLRAGKKFLHNKKTQSIWFLPGFLRLLYTYTN